MKFRQRLMRYLVGVFIGLLFVVFFFGDRNWLGWTPDQKILYHIRETKQALPDQVKCQLECYDFKSADIDSLFVHGDVLLSESNTKSMPRNYIIVSPKNFEPQMRVEVSSGEFEAYVLDVAGKEEMRKCPC